MALTIPAGPRWQKRAGAAPEITEGLARILRAELRPIANPATTAWGQNKTREAFRKAEKKRKDAKVAAFRPVDVAYVIKFAAAQRKHGPIPSAYDMEKEAQWALLARFLPRVAGLFGRAGMRVAPTLTAKGIMPGLLRGTAARVAAGRSGIPFLRSLGARAAGPLPISSLQPGALREAAMSLQQTPFRALRTSIQEARMPTFTTGQAGVRELPPARLPTRGPTALEPHAVELPGVHRGLPPPPTAAGGAAGTAAGTAAAGGKMGLAESYKSVFQPGGLKALWADPWIRWPTYISAAMQAPAVLRGEQDPLTAAFNILAPLPAFRAGILPGMAASFAAPAISGRLMGGGQPQPPPPPPQMAQAPVTVNVAAPSPMPMPQMPMPQMPSMIPGVRTV